MSFYSDLERGKAAETAVINALQDRGHTVIDLSNLPEYQQKDIDLYIMNDTQATTLEIKMDARSEDTGNVFLETQNDRNRNHKYNGWMKYCKADYICFVQPKRHTAHIVRFAELLDDVERHTYRKAFSSNAVGYLMPIAAIKALSSYCAIGI